MNWTLKAHAKFLAETTLKDLIIASDSTARDLKQLTASLKKGGLDAHFNGLGVLQNRGSEIDRLCGELHMIKEIIEEHVDIDVKDIRYRPQRIKQDKCSCEYPKKLYNTGSLHKTSCFHHKVWLMIYGEVK